MGSFVQGTHRPSSEYISRMLLLLIIMKHFRNFHKIDYLQISLEVSNMSTLNTLLKLYDSVFKTHRFAVITFEHDFYRGNYFRTRDLSRIILQDLGYFLLFLDVSWFGCAVCEDWWVHPELVSPQILKKQVYISMTHTNVLKYLDKILIDDEDDWLSYDTP